MSALRDPMVLTQFTFVALCVGAVAAVLLHKTIDNPHFSLVAMLLSVGALPALVGLTWATGLYPELALVWVGRVSTLLLLLAFAVAVLKLHGTAGTLAGRGFILGALAFALAALASEFATGQVGQRVLLNIAGFIAVWLTVTRADWLVLQLKRVVGVYVAGSALAAAFAPFAWTYYDSSLIGIDIRLHGLAAHANALGPLMVLYLILEHSQPSRRWMRWVMGSTAGILLVLSQSKTAWVAAFVVGVVLWAGRSPRTAGVRLAALITIAVTSVGLVAITDDVSEYETVAEERVETFRTLTGRTAVWRYGLEIWSVEPIFGGGTMVFRDYAERHGEFWAGQAHNQYVQTLGRHGLVGLTGLLIYLLVLVRHGLRHRHHTRYASVALVGLLLVRTLTESNIDAFGLEQLVVFGMLLAWERQGIAPPAAADHGVQAMARRLVPSGSQASRGA